MSAAIPYRHHDQDANTRRHGSISSYNKGCRCDDCREARNEAMRQRRRMAQPHNRPDYIPGYDPIRDTLMTFCWCYHKLVPVPRRDVLNGRTGSCGHRDCEPADG